MSVVPEPEFAGLPMTLQFCRMLLKLHDFKPLCRQVPQLNW